MKPFKNSRFAIAVLKALFALSLSNCVVGHSGLPRPSGRAHRLPPGQAKKIHGERSARNFAPGHNK